MRVYQNVVFHKFNIMNGYMFLCMPYRLFDNELALDITWPSQNNMHSK